MAMAMGEAGSLLELHTNQTQLILRDHPFVMELNSTDVGHDLSLHDILRGPAYNSSITPDIDTNWTGVSPAQPVGIVRDIGLGAVLAFLCMLTFVGNAMVLHAVRTERRLQTVSFLRNLNVSCRFL